MQFGVERAEVAAAAVPHACHCDTGKCVGVGLDVQEGDEVVWQTGWDGDDLRR